MLDILADLTAIDTFTFMVLAGLVMAVFGLIRTLFDSTTLAVAFMPVLVLGGLAANYLFRTHFVIATPDKDSNVVVASAFGILIAMILMLCAISISIFMAERRSKAPPPLLPIESPPAQD